MAQPVRPSWLLVALLILAFWIHYSPADQAALLKISPDSLEYVNGAMRLASGETASLRPEGLELPSRYPPFMSYLLAPVYLVTDHPGAGIFVITAAALMSILLSYHMARRWGGESAGLVAAAALTALPLFREWSAQIMTDVPATAASLWAIKALLDRAEGSESETKDRSLHLSFILALAFMLRPALALLGLAAVPLVWRRMGTRRALPFLMWVATVPMTVGLALLAWNKGAYGSMMRSGYQYWIAQIYDDPEQLFPKDAVERNWSHLLDTGLIYGLALVTAAFIFDWLRARRASENAAMPRALPLYLFVLAVALPYLALHLRYYSFRPRYFLPLFPPTIVLLSICLVPRFGRFQNWFAAVALLGLLVLGVEKWRDFEATAPAESRVGVCKQLADVLPEDALVLTALPPDYIRLFLGPKTELEFRILSREEEYASKERSLALGKEVVTLPAIRETADEDLKTIVELVQSGRPVYLLRAGYWQPRSRNLVAQLSKLLALEEVIPGLEQLLPL